MAKVLLIDDSWLTRRGISGILKADGHDVSEAENGRTGIEKALSDSPDLILLDLLMPEMDGFEVLAELKKQEVKTPVIVVSADIQDTVRVRCLEMGAFGFMNKPPKEDELRSLINAAVSGKE